MTIDNNKSINLILAALLTLGCLGSAQAFSIIPATSAASKSFIPSEAYELANGKTGTVTRQPIAFTSISRGGTENFLAVLKAEFPESEGWKFLAAADDLKGSFEVSAYYVFSNGNIGGGVAFDYHPGDADPVSGNDTELHWIQHVVSNHSRKAERGTDKKKGGQEHGTAENRVVFWSAGSTDKRTVEPFYDVVPKGIRGPKSVSRAIPPHFEYDVGFSDPENDHQWKSEVYLASVSKKEPRTVTIYNGVNWGWENKTITDTNPVGQ